MSEEPTEKNLAGPDIFAGAGIGLLLGTVLSMTITPVIAGFVTAITSLLGVFLGLDGSSSGTRMLRVNALRIGSFGLATVVGLALGLYARTNNPMQAAPDVVVQQWAKALPDNPTLAKQMSLFEYSGIEPAAWSYKEGETGVAATINEQKAKSTSGVLYSTLSEFKPCTRLSEDLFGNDVQRALALFAVADAPAVVKSLGESLAKFPEATKYEAIVEASEFLCDMETKSLAD